MEDFSSSAKQIEAHTGKDIGGGLPVIEYWAKNTLSAKGLPVWKTLLHKKCLPVVRLGYGRAERRLYQRSGRESAALHEKHGSHHCRIAAAGSAALF